MQLLLVRDYINHLKEKKSSLYLNNLDVTINLNFDLNLLILLFMSCEDTSWMHNIPISPISNVNRMRNISKIFDKNSRRYYQRFYFMGDKHYKAFKRYEKVSKTYRDVEHNPSMSYTTFWADRVSNEHWYDYMSLTTDEVDIIIATNREVSYITKGKRKVFVYRGLPYAAILEVIHKYPDLTYEEYTLLMIGKKLSLGAKNYCIKNASKKLIQTMVDSQTNKYSIYESANAIQELFEQHEIDKYMNYSFNAMMLIRKESYA